MTEAPIDKTNSGRDKFSSPSLETDISQSSNSPTDRQKDSTLITNSESVAREAGKKEQIDPLSENIGERGGLAEVGSEPSSENQSRSTFQKLKAKITAALIGSAVMLPILAVGTATYYFGTQAVDKQTILAKRANNIDLAQTELVRQQKLLAALLISTGTTALLAGAIAALGTKRLLDSISKKSQSKETAEGAKAQVYKDFIDNLSQPIPQKDILKAVVEEARTYLNCDRVVVYSLNQDKYGTIVGESVAPGYTQWLGITIKDPCFAARYLEKYRNGRVRAINDIDKVAMAPCHKEQLEAMEVKANLVTPIVNEGRLFGLLVAHQCERSREWQEGETEFLHQIAKKTGLALKNAQLLDDMLLLQTQAEKERQWTNYFTDAIQYIRASIKQDDVLEISVEEVRRVLMCDRVVVYSLNPDNKYGAVIAESVTAGYPRALNKTIEDPCFEARYLDKYRDGRVRAINDIYQAGMTKCYIEQLETLEVKANLVTPIVNEGKLFGLLVAHQCSQPRNWQDYEIRWMTQIATQVGFALDNAKLLAASASTQVQAETERQWTNYFTDAIQYIRASIKQDDVLEISVEEVRRVLMCDRVVVYSLNPDNKYGAVIAESVTAGYPRALNKTIEDPCFEARYLDKYRDGRVRAINDIYQAGMTKCYIEQLETLEVKANLVTPILNEGKLFGLLVAHQCSQPRNWQDYEIRWMTQIATQVGFALDNAKLLAASASTQVQAETERKWTNYFTDAIQYIRASIKQDDVLDISVEEVRRVLMCDRVVVYSLNPDNKYGAVIAESVTAGYPRALNKTIEDPCFEARYLDKYRDGRVRAINDIYQAGMTKCYIEQLETLEVKANLVTPILNEGKLFGLLVAHQCSQPRNWQDYEIRWMTQIATQVGFALDNAKLLQKSRETGLPTQSLNNFSLGISERVDRSELLKIAVEQTRKVIKLDRVIVYQFDNNLNGNIVAESVIPGYPRALNSHIKDPCFAREYGEKYRQGRTKAINNIHQANLTSCHLEQLESLSVKASVVVPILQDEQLFGLLIGHQCQQPRQWLQSEIDLFAQLALQLGLALDRVELRTELDAANNAKRDEAEKQHWEQQTLDREISQLLIDNQAALHAIKAKISLQSATTEDFLHQMLTMERQMKAVLDENLAPRQSHGGEIPNKSKNTQIQSDVTAVQKAVPQTYQADIRLRLESESDRASFAIAEAREKVEVLNKSYQSLHRMVNIINGLKEKLTSSPAQNELAQLPMGEITTEASEVNLELINNYDYDLDLTGQIKLSNDSESASSLLLMNQFVEEITNLSDKISQQSSVVTDSFQKLAEFTQQLSESKEP